MYATQETYRNRESCRISLSLRWVGQTALVCS